MLPGGDAPITGRDFRLGHRLTEGRSICRSIAALGESRVEKRESLNKRSWRRIDGRMVESTNALRKCKIDVSNRQIGQPESGIGRFVCFNLVKESLIKRGQSQLQPVTKRIVSYGCGLANKNEMAISIFHA